MVSDQKPDETAAPDSGDPSYVYKPSLIGAPWMLWLRRDGLKWSFGRHSGLVRYDRIRRVRLSFRPVSMQAHRFLTEIWSHDAPKIQIASTSWRGLMEQERLDSAYLAFITELHRRLAAAGTDARFSTGMPVVLYWLGLLVFAGAMLAFAVLTVRAMQMGEWWGAALVGGFFALFAWQVGNFFYRNRPGPYRPDRLPPQALPRA